MISNFDVYEWQHEWPHGGEEFAPDIRQAQLGAKPAEDQRYGLKEANQHTEGPAAGEDSQLHGAKAVQG
jgi:hypothetical protein